MLFLNTWPCIRLLANPSSPRLTRENSLRYHLWLVWVLSHAIWAMQCPGSVSKRDGTDPDRAQPWRRTWLHRCLHWRCACILTDLKKADLKLKLPKCKFFRKEVEFLSHIITGDSLKPNTAHTAAVTNFPESRDIKGIRQFVGLASYYRRLIPNLR